MTSAAGALSTERPRALFGGVAAPIVTIALMAGLTGSWIAAVGIAVLWAIWSMLYEPGEGLVLPLALSFQWLQVTAGHYYFAIAGRRPEWDYDLDTEPMVLVGLCAVLMFAIGIRLGKNLMPAPYAKGPVEVSEGGRIPRSLLVTYAVFLFSSDIIGRIAWGAGGLAQLFLSLILVRFVFLYMVVVHLSRLRFGAIWLGLLFCVELGVGMSGYFASFRESFVIAFMALIGCTRRRRVHHVVSLALLGVMAITAAWVWTGIKQEYRTEYDVAGTRTDRIQRIQTLAEAWWERKDDVELAGDALVDRIWSVELQALAMARVPKFLPHENGSLLMQAVEHVFLPRVFFPDKGLAPNPSDLVRKYSGVWVAGRETGTSFAFGYVIESYIDFGIPVMFLPMLVFGVLAGVAFGWMRRRIRDPLLRAATLSTLFWVSLYLYERSWVRIIGLSITWFVGMCIITWALDRFWIKAHQAD